MEPPPFGILSVGASAAVEGKVEICPLALKCFSLKLIHHTLVSLARARCVAILISERLRSTLLPYAWKKRVWEWSSVCHIHLMVVGRTK